MWLTFKRTSVADVPKLSLEDLLMAILQYLREYRTYEQIAADFGIHESNLIRRSK